MVELLMCVNFTPNCEFPFLGNFLGIIRGIVLVKIPIILPDYIIRRLLKKILMNNRQLADFAEIWRDFFSENLRNWVEGFIALFLKFKFLDHFSIHSKIIYYEIRKNSILYFLLGNEFP